MKKIALLGMLAVLALPSLASAQASQSVDMATVPYSSFQGVDVPVTEDTLFVVPVQSAFSSSTYETEPRVEKAAWYYGADGLMYSNICQTPYFWVNFGNRYYLVGADCIATYRGVTDYGVMVAR